MTESGVIMNSNKSWKKAYTDGAKQNNKKNPFSIFIGTQNKAAPPPLDRMLV
jgi:hypothetical protein